MSTKPTLSLARWADTGSASVTDPPSGSRDTGFVNGDPADEGVMNALLKQYYLWAQYLSDGALSGDHSIAGDLDVTGVLTVTGRGDFAPSTESTYTPIQRSLDWQGKPRAHVDHNGFRMGQVSEWDEHWRISAGPSTTDTSTTDGSTDPEGWTFTGTGGTPANRSYIAPTSTMRQRCVQLATPATGVCTGTLTPNYIAYAGSDTIYVQEWDVETGDVDGGNAPIELCGVQSYHAGGNDWFAYFKAAKDSTSNWRAQVVTGSTSDNDTGVAVANSTVYRMRIEIIGDNAQSGSNFLIRFFINGALVHSQTNAFTSDNVRPYFRIENTTGTADTTHQFKVGRVRACWNHRLDQDAL